MYIISEDLNFEINYQSLHYLWIYFYADAIRIMVCICICLTKDLQRRARKVAMSTTLVRQICIRSLMHRELHAWVSAHILFDHYGFKLNKITSDTNLIQLLKRIGLTIAFWHVYFQCNEDITRETSHFNGMQKNLTKSNWTQLVWKLKWAKAWQLLIKWHR